jgi:hypothetical protein
MRDLIRLHEPSLQRPGALKRLVKEITENADAPRGGERVNMTLSGVGRNVRFWAVGSTSHKRTLSRFRKSSLSQPKLHDVADRLCEGDPCWLAGAWSHLRCLAARNTVTGGIAR